LAIAQEISGTIIFVEMSRVIDAQTTPWTVKGDNHYSNKKIKQYNQKLEEFCQKKSVHLIKIFDILDESDLPDGLHPNAEGHRKIFEQIRDYLLEHQIVR
jgi:lysophospholipase L1-like esterase